MPQRAASLLVLFCMFAGACANAAGPMQPAQKGTWKSPLLGKDLPTELYAPAEPAPGRRGRPGVIYLKGLNTPRIGREQDETILADFIKDGFLVVTVDYGNDPKAAAPSINSDLRVLRTQIAPSKGVPGLFAPERVDQDHTYILPAGYRLARDILYYGEGPEGFRLDIRYPSKPAKPVPVVMQIPVENANRMTNAGHWQWNDLIAEGFLTRGYAAAQVDNPVKQYRGVDPMPEIAIKLKAAVRTIRANARQCNLDAGHIGVMGFSRGSGQAGLLAMTGGVKEMEQGPHLEHSSRVQAALLHAGRMDHLALLKSAPRLAETYEGAFGPPVENRKVWEVHSAISYVTPDDPPTFLSVGANDEYRVAQLALMAGALKKAGVEYKHAITPGMGHQVTGDVKILGDIYDFFDKHLKPQSGK